MKTRKGTGADSLVFRSDDLLNWIGNPVLGQKAERVVSEDSR